MFSQLNGFVVSFFLPSLFLLFFLFPSSSFLPSFLFSIFLQETKTWTSSGKWFLYRFTRQFYRNPLTDQNALRPLNRVRLGIRNHGFVSVCHGQAFCQSWHLCSSLNVWTFYAFHLNCSTATDGSIWWFPNSKFLNDKSNCPIHIFICSFKVIEIIAASLFFIIYIKSHYVL